MEMYKNQEDAVLDTVKAEIEAVLKKHDCAGIVVLSRMFAEPFWEDDKKGPHVNTTCGVAFMLEPTYSELKVEGDEVCLRVDSARHGHDVKTILMKVAPTISMLQSLAYAMRDVSITVDTMAGEATAQSIGIFESIGEASAAGGVSKH